MSERFTVGLIVTNKHGVLNRIAGMYAKRCYNINSLSVGETEDPTLSRMTIVSTGDEYIRKQVVRQLSKLYDVKAAFLLDEDSTVSVEHLLIKLKINECGNGAMTALINEYGGKFLEVRPKSVIVSVTGTPEKIQEFIEKCKPLGIYELCRSGALALSVNENPIPELNNNENETEIIENEENVL